MAVMISPVILHWPPFLVRALLAGTAVAAAAGLVGYFLVLRAQVFTADALSHVAFTGALAALVLGIDLRAGLFAATVAVALAMGVLGRRGSADDVVIGTVFAWVLGLGVFLLTLYTTTRSSGNGSAGVTVLFGSIFGMSRSQALAAALIAAAVCGCVVAIARPLLFASIDEAVAAARGVPVRLLGFGFLTLVAVAVAEASQVVGALLLLGLLAAPAGTAQQVTVRPYHALLISAVIAMADVWIGLALSYTVPSLPPSSAIVAVAAAGYALALLLRRTRRSAAA